MVYLDSSAIVKLVVHEAESAALRRFLRSRPARGSCAIARVEVPRAVAAVGTEAVQRARLVVGALQLVQLDDALLDAAGALSLAEVRSLDAIHIAAARELGDDLDCLVTHDRRMTVAAEAIGSHVAAPA